MRETTGRRGSFGLCTEDQRKSREVSPTIGPTMPPIRTCGKKWNVASDDFVLPSLAAIIIRLISIGFVVGVLLYLFVGLEDCPEREDVPPFLYGSLFAIVALEFIVVLNENLIFSVSARGDIYDLKKSRKSLMIWIAVRVVLYFIEFPLVLTCAVAVFTSESFGAGALVCSAYHNGPLVFAKVVVILLIVSLLIYGAGFLIFVDPFGCCCAPSILPDMRLTESLGEQGGKRSISDKDLVYLNKTKVAKLNRNYVSYGRYIRKLRNFLCCLNAGGKRSRVTAMQDLALALHTIFTTKCPEDKLVPSDIWSGLVLVSRDQKRRKLTCEACKDGATRCPCLIEDFKELTFECLSSQVPAGYDHKTPHREFEWDKLDERVLFEDLVHYMHYAMGVYGWPLHVFDKICCGFCELCTVTCCVCNYRCFNKRYGVDIVKDDMCMSGVGTIRLRSKIRESEILYVSYINEIWEAPYSICVDHQRQSLVVTVRGTLSIKDALTDLSVNMVPIDEEYKVAGLREKQYQFVHNGAYNTAKNILETLEGHLEQYLTGEYANYTLVITGHSLGAGVASVLALLLRPKYKDLVCYAFSPPGCIFSFPLAHYSRDFITSVVLGNDLIPRVTYRSLFYLKRQVLHLVKTCKVHKIKILCLPRWVDSCLPRPLRDCLFGKNRLPETDLSSIQTQLKEVIQKRDEEMKQKEFRKRKTSGSDPFYGPTVAKKLSRRWRKKTFAKDSLHHFVEGIENGEQVAAFPPGKIIHIEIRKGAKPWCLGYCAPNRMKVHTIPSEDLCVIKMDRGMIEDHLPNNVLESLKRCQQQKIVARGYDHPDDTNSETWRRRMELHDERLRMRAPSAPVVTKQPSNGGVSLETHSEVSVSKYGNQLQVAIEVEETVDSSNSNTYASTEL